MCWWFFRNSGAEVPWAKAMTALGRTAPQLEQDLETFTTGEMGILVRPSRDQDAPAAQAELERALTVSDTVRAYRHSIELDPTGHPWILVRAHSLPDLTEGAAAAGDALVRTGIGPRIIAGVFPFRWRDKRLYWVYQPRVRGFTPFVPMGETEEEGRDHEVEVRMAGVMQKGIPVVRNTMEWYPVWDMPL